MTRSPHGLGFYLFAGALAVAGAPSPPAFAQAVSGTVSGTVSDSTGAAIPGATVQLSKSVSGLNRTTTTDASGQFRFTNVPADQYRLSATSSGFKASTQTVAVSSALPVTANLTLGIS